MFDWILFQTEDDFKRFTSEPYHQHIGKPDSYPCFGKSCYHRHLNGPNEHEWTFVTVEDLRNFQERLNEGLNEVSGS